MRLAIGLWFGQRPTTKDQRLAFLRPETCHLLERHFFRCAARAAFPGQKQAGVGVGDVMLGADAELAGGLVDPA